MKYYKTGNDVYIGDPFGDAIELTEEEYNEIMAERARINEIESLKKYLNDTDYIYAKCIELGLDVNIEYAETVQSRKDARDRINELEEPNV